MSFLKKCRNRFDELFGNPREILWGSIFRDTVTDSPWLKNKSFSPGRWAAGYPMLYILYRVLNDTKPRRILEFGLGESSKLTYQYVKSHGNCELTIIEQDRAWLDFFEGEVFPVKEFTHICPVEKRLIDGTQSYIYGQLDAITKDRIYDFVIIDGPWGSEKNSRSQMVDIVTNNIDPDNFVIILDDYNRKGERQTFRKAREVLRKAGKDPVVGTYQGCKTTAIMCSGNYRFLCSL